MAELEIHTEVEGGDPFGKKIGVLASILAVFLGVVTIVSHRAHTDAVLAKGSTIEMILDRPLIFAANEVNFASTAGASHFSDGGGPIPAHKDAGTSNPVRRLPF